MPPVVVGGAVICVDRPVILAWFPRFDVIAVHIERAPSRIANIVVRRSPDVPHKAGLDRSVATKFACASTKEGRFAPPAQSGQRNWTRSSSQKQIGQMPYE